MPVPRDEFGCIENIYTRLIRFYDLHSFYFLSLIYSIWIAFSPNQESVLSGWLYTVHIDCSHHQAVIHPPQTLSILHCESMTYHQTLSWPLWSLQVSLSSPSFQCSQALTSGSQFDWSPLITRNSPARSVTSVKWRWFPQTHSWHHLAREFINLSVNSESRSKGSLQKMTYQCPKSISILYI